MAAITSASTGLWSATATWTGGVVPVSTDTVTIASPHVVTLDGSRTAGNDVAAGLTIASGATLKASRSVSCTLTMRGGMTVNGTLDWGTVADPIPAGRVAKIIPNDSATLAQGKYKITIGQTGRASFVGATARSRNATLVSYAGSSAVVTGATGWAVGDTLVFPPSTSTDGVAGMEQVTISALSVSGAETTLTLSAALTKTHAAGWPVGNITPGEVQVDCLSTTQASGFVTPGATITYPNDVFYAENAWFNWMGNDANSAAMLYGSGTAPATATPLAITVKKCALVNALCLATLTDRCTFTYDNTAIVGGNTTTGYLFIPANSGKVVATNGTSIYRFYERALSKSGASASGYRNYDWSGGCISGFPAAKQPIVGSGFEDIVLSGARIQPCTTLLGAGPGTRLFLLDGCRFDSAQIHTAAAGRIVTVEVRDSYPGSSELVGSIANMYADDRNYVRVINGDGSPLTQIEAMTTRKVYRDNATSKRGTSAIRIDPKSTAAQTYAIQFLAASGAPARLRGAIRFNSAHGTATPPSVTISGLGITPVTYTAPATADAWHEWELEVTQTSGGDGLLTLTMTAQSTNTTTSSAWFDGVVAPPYVTRARWYGDLLQDTVPTRTADPLITYTEAAALAVAGVAIDHDAETITVTAAATAQDVWHYAIADLCQTANIARPVHISSPDGTSFATGYEVILGSGGSISGRYSDVNGAVVSAAISNIVPGSQILIVRTDTAAVMANTTVAGSLYSLNVQTASAIPISVRVRKASSAPYYQEWTTTGVIDPVGGFAATANQQPDQ